MEKPELSLTLIPAPGDPPQFHTPECQKDLWRFQQSIGSQGTEIYSEIDLREGGGASAGWYLGEFFIKLAPGIGPVAGAAIGAWLHAKYGRKVRLKVGDIEAEAQTEEQVKRLLEHAEEFRQRNQPKVVHEP